MSQTGTSSDPVPQATPASVPDLSGELRTLEAGMYHTPEVSQTQITALLTAARSAGDEPAEALALCLLAGCAFYTGDLPGTVNLLNLSLDLARPQGDRVLEARLLNGLGLAHDRLGEYDLALEFFLQSLRLTQELDDQMGVFRALNNLASLYADTGHPLQALNFHQQAHQVALDLKTPAVLASSMTHLISIHDHLGHSDEVLALANEHAMQIRDAGPARWYSSVQECVGRAHLRRGDAPQALATALSALTPARDRHDQEGICRLALTAARAHLTLHEHAQAHALLRECLDISRDVGSRPMESQALETLAELHEAQGEHQQALRCARAYFELERQIHAREVETRSHLLTAQIRLELLTREAEIERLRNVELAEANHALQETQSVLLHRATHDSLTGVANRAHFMHLTNQALTSLQPGEFAALIFIDLDKFKNVNDTLGHHAGDLLLQQVARRLCSAVRSSDLVGRLGGDEFTVLLRRVNAGADVGVIARKLLETLVVPFMLDGQATEITASVGWAVAPTDGRDAEALQQHADIAMYRVKHGGGGAILHFEPEMGQDVHEHRQLERELRGAEERRELRLHYQGRFEPDGTLVGFEALVRWQHPIRGLIPPDRFIPLAEDTRLILPIGAWVLREACEQAVRWNFSQRNLCMSVNVSPMQFEQPEFVVQVRETLHATGLDRRCLILELTESMVMRDLDRAQEHMSELRTLGVGIAIDDFGTGYSSLSVLHALHFDHLKIDRSFTRGLESSSANPARITQVMTAMITLAHNLNMSVTVEGVEEHAQLQLLRTLGCDHVQGYLLTRPVPAELAEEFIPVATPASS
ncbi:EAL domain-containing protein [Deinococcus yunweiensis]|uniref:EAL domain-containing protein n=1 Tax=Deinococcus yunweiensis TaxID=367282 RepID=UPI00398E910C